MGLDIRACAKLVEIGPVVERDGDLYDPVTDNLVDTNTKIVVYPNDAFPDRASPLKAGVCYRVGKDVRFRAGSYGGYNSWRSQLAYLAGYKTQDAWDGKCDGLPFVELVNFSDCEGVIGPIVSAKLARDFAEHDDKAKAVGGYFYEKYTGWREAFEIASDGGCVDFR